jgi:hypothetical protein
MIVIVLIPVIKKTVVYGFNLIISFPLQLLYKVNLF